MYNPSAFKITEESKLKAFIRRYSFATVVSSTDQGPVAFHVPLLFDETRGKYGTLEGHFAKANGDALQMRWGQSVLCIFNGPHGYISPSWYTDPVNVPTWNYAVVHARGRPQLIQDPQGIERILEKTVVQYESQFENPWNYSVPEDYRLNLIKGIVGFEIEIESIEGKFKLSQNRSGIDAASALKNVELHYGTSQPDLVEMMKTELRIIKE